MNLIGSIQTYEMILPISQKHKDSILKVSKDDVKDNEMPYDLTSDELTWPEGLKGS